MGYARLQQEWTLTIDKLLLVPFELLCSVVLVSLCSLILLLQYKMSTTDFTRYVFTFNIKANEMSASNLCIRITLVELRSRLA